MILDVFETIIAILLTIVILLQMQGTGLSSTFGGGGESFRSKRSLEKFLTYATVVLTAIFALISILLLVRK